MREEDSRDYFDTRPGVLNTITEAAHRLGSFNFKACAQSQNLQARSLIYILYTEYRDASSTALGGFLVWKRYLHDCSIEGYRDHAALVSYQEFTSTLSGFIDLALSWQETLCFQAMDARALEALKQKKTFQEELLQSYQIAIPQRYIEKTISSPSEIHGLVRHPRIRFTVP